MMRNAIRVWDLPTRLFHWLLVALFAFSWWSAENREMEWHLLSGTVLLGLLAFRLLWGLFGGSTARFGSFVKSPLGVARYLRGRATALPGHNPLGGYSVVAMLALLVVQVATGLFATDVDGLDSGPLSFLVSFEQGRSAAGWHELAFNLSLVMIAIHVAAIAYYLVARRRNLVTPMITGRDTVDTAEALRPAGAGAFLIAAAVAAALAWGAYRGFGL